MFLKSLKLKGILSFRDTELELRPLNVLIGPNGSGKSNLIEVIRLLRTLSKRDGLVRLTSEGAGVAEWLWAGQAADGKALIEGTFEPPGSQAALQYELGFRAGDRNVRILHERLIHEGGAVGARGTFERGHPLHSIAADAWLPLLHLFYARGEDVLTAVALGRALERTCIYRELGLGPGMAGKSVQPTDQPGDFLEEDGSNLFLILNRMELDGSREEVEEHFRRFYEPVSAFKHSGPLRGQFASN